MNNDTFKQAFSTLHASDEIKLESDMEERKTSRKFHARPALAVCLCVAAALGCFSTAFALDAGGVKTAVEEGVKTIQLKAGETWKNTGEDGSEQIVEVAEDTDFDIDVVKDNSNETITLEIRDKDSKAESGKDTDTSESEKSVDKKADSSKKASSSKKADSEKKTDSSNSESDDKSSDEAKESK